MSNSELSAMLCIGLLAAGLAIAAECAKTKTKELTITQSGTIYAKTVLYKCKYPDSRDHNFAAASAVVTFANTILIFVVNYLAYSYYKDRNDELPALAILCLVFSCMASISGSSTLATGAAYSKHQINRSVPVDNPEDCKVFSSGYFIAGALLALKACAFGIMSYNSLMNNAENAQQLSTKQTVEMGKTTLEQPDINDSVVAA
ncbi:uncharacterized protein LOC110736963 [Chenopodium quinoa]|uniref:uncharacterized protein LOC110736963 n=1 Tax=Chenopodium quinoa TaxID=63459 RepID=UPI000B7723D6|nr:uncharacterized protein LOC110736963 [Chenopodium quinoa]